MKIGICSANSGPYATRAMLDSLADLAEEAGVESVWVSEHPVLADPREPPSPIDPGDPILDARQMRHSAISTGPALGARVTTTRRPGGPGRASAIRHPGPML